MPIRHPTRGRNLKRRITCPHCWLTFTPEEVLWVARHSDLIGDSVLGPEAPLRFLPSRFNAEGHALDPKGFDCHDMACPRCHLCIPRHLLECDALFISIAGSPACGKSFFLTSMSWSLRAQLPSRFNLSFGDADPAANRILILNEELLFLNPKPSEPVTLKKTELQGELYDQLIIQDQVTSLPKPFLFSLLPTEAHAGFESAGTIGRVIVLYDNAGEHFEPGRETVANPVTEHLGRSAIVAFVFDPTQDTRFRENCASADPQMAPDMRVIRQETILQEVANRVRYHLGVPQSNQVDRALVVVVSKCDAWSGLLEADLSSEPMRPDGTLDIERIEATSDRTRDLLARLCPAFVGTAENFSSHVVYVPVSALGRSPERDTATGALVIRPDAIKPVWVTVPFTYAFAKWAKGLIAGEGRSPNGQAGSSRNAP